MKTKVVPFNPVISGKQSSQKVSEDLETLIQEYELDGWNFYNFYTSETMISGSAGCFGLGAKPSYNVNVGFVVFTKD